MTTPPGASAADAVPSSPPGLPSSPPSSLLSPTRSSQSKERRVPSVTPRRFRKFFTPRTLQQDTSRMALAILDAPAINRLPPTPQSSPSNLMSSDPIIPSSPLERRNDKRRLEAQAGSAPKRQRGALLGKPHELLPTVEAEEDGSTVSASKEDPGRGSLSARRKATLVSYQVVPRVSTHPASNPRSKNCFFKASHTHVFGLDEKPAMPARNLGPAHLKSPLPLCDYKPQPVRKFSSRGLGASLLEREHGLCSRPGKQYVAFPAADPRTETAAFYSDRHDTSLCTPLDQAGTSLPFSLASCHAAAVTAIGDEHGCIRFFSTTKSTGPVDKLSSIIKVHDNAIMHLDFSADDCRLASACGDRSGRILDVHTQSVAVELADGHWDSLRQVSFQPGEANGNVLASSDRAGRVQVWDLRCSSLPVQCFSAGRARRDVGLDIAAAKTVNAIDRPHQRTTQGCTSAASVTALQWLPAGRQHLLLTGSEANASIKLWDTRYVKPRRQTAETPVAVTPEPATHTWRSYGITSMALGSDAARLYAVCKDSTVYAYLTNHLVLGHAPELADAAGKRKPGAAAGLGPLYGLKHDLFRVGSFYVKCAVRRSPGLGSDLLAVGSSDACAVLFPIDERYMRAAWADREHRDNNPPNSSSSSSSKPGGVPSPFALVSPSTPGQSACASSSSLPLLRAAGTPLVRGHSREVTVLSWASHGALVSASDDCLVRQWQPNAARARHLRRVGEFGGERHLAGWADVGADWDCDDDDDAGQG